MTSVDEKKRGYLRCIDLINETQFTLNNLNSLYTENYHDLKWKERKPDIIKNLISVSRNLIEAKFLLFECVMQEEADFVEEINGEIIS